MPDRASNWLLGSSLLALSIVAMLVALAFGSVSISIGDVLAVLGGDGQQLHRTLILELRLPRAIAAFATGGLLALAGALMQVLLRNPLADPYILGVSGGAAVGALVVMLLGFGGLMVGGAAFGGALLSTLLVFSLAHGRGGWTPTRLLLTGVVIAAGWSALISLLLALGPDSSLRSMLFWLMGDLSYSSNPGIELAILGVGLLAILPFTRHLNLLARGDLQARTLGVPVQPLNIGIYLVASLFTAVAVTQGGSIGFVGLVVPHMLRLVAGADHRRLLPGAALAGGSLLVLADTLARTVIAPRQLPVGVVTAFIGVPLFLYLLNRSRSQV
jgi:iron complex transport system permease protein